MSPITLFSLFLFLVGLFAFSFYWKNSKGSRGEKWVTRRLERLDTSKYLVINDLLLRYGANSAQIDHVVVSVYGIFVIETKYYKGWVYGGAESEYWTQNIYGKKFRLRNPVLQNQGHIRAIKRSLKLREGIPVYSIVAFSRQASLGVNPTLPVMYWRQVVPYIRQYDQPRLSETEVREIYDTLLSAGAADDVARKQHVQNVRQNQRRRDLAVSQGRCPRCGGELVLRNGQYGRFYGCSNYPRCRYTLHD